MNNSEVHVKKIIPKCIQCIRCVKCAENQLIREDSIKPRIKEIKWATYNEKLPADYRECIIISQLQEKNYTKPWLGLVEPRTDSPLNVQLNVLLILKEYNKTWSKKTV